MEDDSILYQEVFNQLYSAHRSLWLAVELINDANDEDLKPIIKELVRLSGELHVEGMRPLYKKYPKLAIDVGWLEAEG